MEIEYEVRFLEIDKERIIEMANQLIEETIQEDSYQNDIKEEIFKNVYQKIK